MEDKKTAIAILLCIIVVMVYSELFIAPMTRPPVAPQVGTEQAVDNIRQPAQVASPYVQPNAEAKGAPVQANIANSTVGVVAQTSQHPTPLQLEQSPVTKVETNKFIMEINHLGGRVSSFKLKHYKKLLDSPELLDLIQTAENTALPLGVHSDTFNDEFVQYSLKENQNSKHLIVRPNEKQAIEFEGTLPDGRTITKTLTIDFDSYLFDVDVRLSEPTANGSKIWVEWTNYVSKKNVEQRYNLYSITTLGVDDKLDILQASSVTEENAELQKNQAENRWIAFGSKYFMNVLIPEKSALTRYGRNAVFSVQSAGDSQAAHFKVYVGPKNYDQLKLLGYELQRTVDLGWFAFLAHPLLWMLRLFYKLLHNWGLAIILLTLFIKTLFLPLTKASLKSMKAMQDLQPEIKALRERIKDPTQLNKEMMGLYKQRGVNPMGGCLPMLIQLPVFLGLYNALLNAIELRHAPFALWINDLSSPEKFELFGISIPVMIIIMGLSMLVQQITTPSTGDPAQKKAMLLMPVIFTVMFIIFPFPAGLVLYWLTNNLISIFQQIHLKRDNAGSPLQSTVIASILIFGFGFILTLI